MQSLWDLKRAGDTVNVEFSNYNNAIPMGFETMGYWLNTNP